MNSVKSKEADRHLRELEAEERRISFQEACSIFNMEELQRDCGLDVSTFQEKGKEIWEMLNDLQSKNPLEYQEHIRRQMNLNKKNNDVNEPVDILRKQRNLKKESQEIKISGEPCKESKNMVSEITHKATKASIKSGFLNVRQRPALYPNGSNEGAPKSIFQKCQIVEL